MNNIQTAWSQDSSKNQTNFCTGCRIPVNPSFYVYIILILILFKQKCYMIKYENSTLKRYIRNIKHYTDIDPTVDFVFPVNKIDREKGEKTNLKLTKCIFRSCNQRPKYVFTSKDHCNVHHFFFYRNIASVVASCNTNNFFFSVPRFPIHRRKKIHKN